VDDPGVQHAGGLGSGRRVGGAFGAADVDLAEAGMVSRSIPRPVAMIWPVSAARTAVLA
jgi:hypothetical protein